jgi:phage terminase large subunit
MFIRTTSINKLLKLKKKIRIVPGGTSAGKTFGIIPILIDYAIKNPNSEISICSESVPHLKRGAIRDFLKIMKSTNRFQKKNWTSSNSVYTFTNDSFIEFFSVEQEDKVRGPRRDVLYINEANRIDFETFHQLLIRTRKVIWLDFNPSNEFWVHDELKDDSDCETLILTYKDNEALDETIIKEIEKALIKGFHDPNSKDLFAESNIKSKFWSNWWKVYGLGLLGQLEGAIFQNWEFGEFDNKLPFAYGQDFGVKDKDAVVKVAVDNVNKIIYVDEILYKSGMSTDQLYNEIKDEVGKSLIVADSAGARTIIDLLKKGLNIKAVSKNKVIDDIKLIQGYKIIITERSTNLANELRKYIWLDKKGEVPIDEFNHLLDAMRYIVQTLLYSRKKTKMRVLK